MNASVSNLSTEIAYHDCFNQSTSSNLSEVLFRVTVIIRQVAPPPFLVLGILGNFLTIGVLLRQVMTKTFTGVSLLFLAVADNMTMLALFLPDWLGAVAGQDFRSLGNTDCKNSWFITFISQIVSPWALVAITMERVACVWPLEAKKSFTPKVSICIHACFFAGAIAMSFLTVDVFGVSERALNVYGFACASFAQLGDTDLAAKVMGHVVNVMVFHVPFILLIAGNSVIWKKMTVRKKCALQRGDATNSTRYKKLCNLVASLNVVFFISKFPLSVYLFIDEPVLDWVFSGSCEDEFWYRLGVYRLTWACCNVMALVSPSTNFLLYFVSSPQFRQEIKASLKGEKPGETIQLIDRVGTACTTV